LKLSPRSPAIRLSLASICAALVARGRASRSSAIYSAQQRVALLDQRVGRRRGGLSGSPCFFWRIKQLRALTIKQAAQSAIRSNFPILPMARALPRLQIRPFGPTSPSINPHSR
jgi:hypothetical protein